MIFSLSQEQVKCRETGGSIVLALMLNLREGLKKKVSLSHDDADHDEEDEVEEDEDFDDNEEEE